MDALKRLKTIPLEETLKKLEISYISLEEEYKEIFLNVACFLKGCPKAEAIKVLESCGFYARSGLRVLDLKSLITVNNFGHLGMHDHIEEMGMNIVRRSHPDNPNKHSRLWIDEEIKDVLANDLGTEATRYIQFKGELSPEIVMQGLRKMKELRFLRLFGGLYDASESQNWKYKELPNALRYLCWREYPFRSLPTTFQADNLVSLEMPFSSIVQLWEGEERKVLNKLRFLDLSHSELRTCDLRSAPNLETLDLGQCVDLIELLLPDICLNLRSLKLSKSKLRTLDIGLSPNLEYLDLRDCHHLEEFHMANGCLKTLVYLDLSRCLMFRSFKFQIQNGASCSADESLMGGPLAELYLIAESVDECRFHPDSNLPKYQFQCHYKEDRPLLTRNFEKLISIGLCACTNPDTFTRSICGLQQLRKLTLEGSILEAPKDLDQLQCLWQLVFSDTKIRHLPDNICGLKHLKSINLIKCSLLKKLPDDLSQLEFLKNLEFSYSNIEVLPGSICKLKHLKSLKLDGWSLLQKLPEDLGQLQCLKRLDLSTAKIKYLPDSICMLQHLIFLILNGCLLLEKLPEDLGRLERLEDLNLIGCKLLREVPDSICKMKCLRYLNLRDCFQVEKLPEEIGLLECLESLYLQNTGISHLPQSILLLKALWIYGSAELLQSCGFTSKIWCSSPGQYVVEVGITEAPKI